MSWGWRRVWCFPRCSRSKNCSALHVPPMHPDDSQFSLLLYHRDAAPLASVLLFGANKCVGVRFTVVLLRLWICEICASWKGRNTLMLLSFTGLCINWKRFWFSCSYLCPLASSWVAKISHFSEYFKRHIHYLYRIVRIQNVEVSYIALKVIMIVLY